MVIFNRFVVPEWIKYRTSINTCKWNFTSSGEPGDCNIEIDPSPDATTPFYMKLETDNFTMFRFSDILSFNMTFVVDPDDKLPKGKGDVPSMIVAYPSCLPSVYADWGTDEEMCGPFKGEEVRKTRHCFSVTFYTSGVKVVVTSPECVDVYTISDSCGISASSALGEDTLPGNVILDDDTYWAPAIR